MSQEVIKMKQGMSYSCKEKTIILNVFKYFREIHPEKCITDIVRCTSKATGCSEKSIFQFRKEEASPEGFKEPSKTKIRKNININSRFIKYDESVREAIKFIIYDLKNRDIVPSLSTILKHVNSNDKLPNFSLMTLRRLLFDMGFRYEKEKNTNKSMLVEKTNKYNLDDPKKKHVKTEVKSNFTDINKFNNPVLVTFPETVPQNQISYMSNQNHIMDGMPIGIQHTMMVSHRIPHAIHPISHNMGFLQHSHNIIAQQ